MGRALGCFRPCARRVLRGKLVAVRKFELGIYSEKRGTRHVGIAKAQKYLARFG